MSVSVILLACNRTEACVFRLLLGDDLLNLYTADVAGELSLVFHNVTPFIHRLIKDVYPRIRWWAVSSQPSSRRLTRPLPPAPGVDLFDVVPRVICMHTVAFVWM